MLEIGKALSNLIERYKRADRAGRDVLRDVILNMGAAAGQYDAVKNMLVAIDMGRVAQEEAVPEAAPEAAPPEEAVVEVPVEKPVKETEEAPAEGKEVPGETVKEPAESKKVLEDLETKKVLNEISKQLKQIWEKMDTIEDAVSQHKKIIERLISPEKFEEQKRPLREKDVVTPEEFGLRFYSNLNSDIDKKKFMKIRRNAMAEEKEKEEKEREEKEVKEKADVDPTIRRKQRLARRYSVAEEVPKTLRDVYKVPEDIEKMKKLPQIPGVPYATQEQLEERKKRERERYPLWLKSLAAHFDEDRGVWQITHENKALYEVPYSPDIAPSKADFASRTFGKVLLRDFIRLGEDFVKKYNAVYVGGQDEKEPAPSVEEKVQEAPPQEEKKEALLRFMQGLNLVSQMLEKNLVDNPLKASFYDELRTAKVSSPVTIVESAFKKGYKQFVDSLVSLARKYSELDAKSFAELESFVRNAKSQTPVETTESVLEEIAAAEMRRRAAEGSVPIVTDSSGGYNPLKDAVPKPINWNAVQKK
jgi:hypothetical protein